MTAAARCAAGAPAAAPAVGAGRRSLPGHPAGAARPRRRRKPKRFLLLAARDWDPTYRAAAVEQPGLVGAVPPRPRCCCACRTRRRDPNPEVRQAARAALARLGERQALQWFRQALTSEDTQRVHEAIQVIAAEATHLPLARPRPPGRRRRPRRGPPRPRSPGAAVRGPRPALSPDSSFRETINLAVVLPRRR